MGRLVVSSEEGILVVLFWSWGILYGWCLIFKWLGLKIKVGHLHSSSINGHQGDMPYCTHFSQWLDAVRKIKDVGWCWLNKSFGIEFSRKLLWFHWRGLTFITVTMTTILGSSQGDSQDLLFLALWPKYVLSNWVIVDVDIVLSHSLLLQRLLISEIVKTRQWDFMG